MFTSRAEFRLRLREDNADQRLTPIGRDLGLVDDERWAIFEEKMRQLDVGSERVRSVHVNPATELSARFAAVTGERIGKGTSLSAYIRRPAVSLLSLVGELPAAFSSGIDEGVFRQLEIELKYEGYIKRQNEEISKIRRHETIELPEDLVYQNIPGLSNELQDKLSKARPASLARASRIPGITPAALSLLLVHAKKLRAESNADRATYAGAG